jgi:hypothetical protein
VTAERRKFVRKPISGTAEITAVHGSGDVPEDRAAILDCSRGGALLKLPAPRRRLLQKTRPLEIQDSVTCVLRVAPTYQEVEVFAEVVRRSFAGNAEEQLVGLRFFYDASRRSHTDKSMRHLIQALGPEAWGSSESHALPLNLQPKPSDRLPKKTSARVSKTSARVSKTSARVSKTSARVSKTSARNSKASARNSKTSARVSKTSARNSKTSARVSKTSARVSKASARVEKTTPRLPGETRSSEASSSSRRGKVTLKYHSSSSGRIPAAPSAPIYFGLAGPESGLYLRGTLDLTDGRAVIDLPGHFADSAEPGTLTVHLTPAGECQGLFVAERSVRRVVVLECGEGKSDAPFDYLLIARRRGT